MGIDTIRRRPLDRLAELPWALWFGLHVLLYLGVWLAGYVVYAFIDVTPGVGIAENLLLITIGVMFLFPLWALLSVAGTVCLGVLRLLSDVRWYWFRLAAILLFAVPFPLFVFSTYGLRMALPVAGAQLVTALLIVQPRNNPGGWANRNPATADHL
ncbi:hypothetical protein LADH09A_002961 [Micromonospora sp. LAH09]|uniref:hypothetical protein n=1 Tax=Micromonospora cabrerizensis TaxID=2911213 RepID=UPI001EE8244B|nr:hypothetical protein [Micromonospora cabrerizensis]MCG5469056.1 hypothetical protein [Micromonospora cabrerizensis]